MTPTKARREAEGVRLPNRPARQNLSGVLLLDKPAGITSQRAVSRVKGLTNAAKVGHTGTLDPMATGLLPLTFGEATKFSHTLLEADKAYRAVVQLGITTTTGDAEGEVVERREVKVDRASAETAIASFVGETEQTPPMHSALKVSGKPLYAYARAGQDVERAPRRIRISRAEVVDLDGVQLTIDVECSKGTYIRVLAEDLGRALGCGGSLVGLRRTRVGRFCIEDAVALDTLGEMDESERIAQLMAADALVEDLPRVDLASDDAARLLRGQVVNRAQDVDGLVRVYGPDAAFLGVADAFSDRVVARRLVAVNGGESLSTAKT